MSSTTLAGRGSSRRRGATFVILVAICVVLLGVSDTAPVSEVRRGINFAISPVRDGLSDSTRSVTRILGAFADIDTLRRENVALQAQVDELEDELAVMETVLERNRQLSRVLDTRKALDNETVVAEVVGHPASQFERVLTLDRGQEVGIELGDPVLSEGGALAGTIIDVGEGFSAVRLINDTRSLVTGRDRRTRALGDVVGRLAAPLAMDDIPVTDKVNVGDIVTTAGIDLGKRFKSSYPKGLPIGRIVDVRQEPGSIVQTALVEPSADLDRIEVVLVITDHKGPKRPARESTEEE